MQEATVKTHVCRPVGRPSSSADPGTGKVNSARTEAPPCCCGSRRTRHRSRRPSPRRERRQSDTSLSARGSYILTGEKNNRDGMKMVEIKK